MLPWEQSVLNHLKIKYYLIVALTRELKPAGLHYSSKSRPVIHQKYASLKQNFGAFNYHTAFTYVKSFAIVVPCWVTVPSPPLFQCGCALEHTQQAVSSVYFTCAFK